MFFVGFPVPPPFLSSSTARRPAANQNLILCLEHSLIASYVLLLLRLLLLIAVHKKRGSAVHPAKQSQANGLSFADLPLRQQEMKLLSAAFRSLRLSCPLSQLHSQAAIVVRRYAAALSINDQANLANASSRRQIASLMNRQTFILHISTCDPRTPVQRLFKTFQDHQEDSKTSEG